MFRTTLLYKSEDYVLETLYLISQNIVKQITVSYFCRDPGFAHPCPYCIGILHFGGFTFLHKFHLESRRSFIIRTQS